MPGATPDLPREGVAKADKIHSAMHVVASVLEHRGSDGTSRVADVTLLKGVMLARGSFKTTGDGTSEKVSLMSIDKPTA